MIKFQIKLNISHKEPELNQAVLKLLKCKEDEVNWKIEKRSIDARDKSNVLYVYSITAEMKKKASEKALSEKSKGKIVIETPVTYKFPVCGTKEINGRPVIIGCGPAGLFSAYMLALSGFKPLIIERGQNVDDRTKDVQNFWDTGVLNPESNVQFGEGGAGTFSDGKLNTGVKDKFGRIGFVLKTFVENGADPDILINNKPHIGTDDLKITVKNLREKCKEYGAEFLFNTKVTDLIIENDNSIGGVILNNGDKIYSNVVILAIGHSARDTFEMLAGKKLLIEKKAFAIGVRIEHLQELIGKGQYGEAYKKLPAADYKMTHTCESGRGVYSFCMCPGGVVVNASSEQGKTVVNGMSYHARNGRNANSAIVVQVNPEDFEKEGYTDILAGVKFQRKWEEACYSLCDGAVPVQRFTDFADKRQTTEFGSVIPDIKGKFQMSELSTALPEYVRHDIIEGVTGFDRTIKGFADGDAVLSGVETRTSSPIRIVRNDNFESLISGLYPCGEGAGYAGGIMSAAVDGIKVFEAIAANYKPMIDK